MGKDYECCICHEPIEKNKRLVYQVYDNKPLYGAFHNKCTYDFCDKCFRKFKVWILTNRKEENTIELGVEIDLKER